MSRAKQIADQLLWLIGHLTFTVIVNLSIFGLYHAYMWYQETPPVEINISELNTEELNQLSKELFKEQQLRK